MTDIGVMVRAANPVPEDSQQLTDDELSAVLLLAQQRSGDMDVQELTKPVEPDKSNRPGWLIAALAFGAIIVVVGAAMLLTRDTTDELPSATTPPTTEAAPTTTVTVAEEPEQSADEPAEAVAEVSAAQLATIEAYEIAVNSGDPERIRAMLGPAFKHTDESTVGEGWFATADMWVNQQAYLVREGASVTYTDCAPEDDAVSCLETWSGPRMIAVLDRDWTYNMEFMLGQDGVVESLHGYSILWPDHITEELPTWEAMVEWAVLEVDTETAGRLKQCGPGSAGEGFAELEGAALCGEWLQRWVDAGRP